MLREHFKYDGQPKKSFDTLWAAQDHIDFYMEREHYSAYECSFCNKFHIGRK